MFGAFGDALSATCLTFVSQAASESVELERLGLLRRLAVTRGSRRVGKRDMILNDWQPDIRVDPQTYEVRADGELLTCEPAKVLPMAQRYFLF
jgi:urease subunit alpha